MDNCSTLTDWEQRQRCALPSSETCSSLMTVQSLPSPNNNFSVSWIGSPKLAKTSGSPSAWKRPTFWAKTWTSHLLLPSTAMNWMLSILPWFHHQRQPGRQPALDAEINQRSGKATTMLGPLTTRFWENPKLTVATNIAVNEACIISTLLYGSEAWTIYAKQERKLNSLHMRSLHLILGIIWSERVA